MTDNGHKRHVVVWDVPAAIGCGERFSIRVGVKCPSGCPASGAEFEVFDSQRKAIAKASVGTDPATGTESLFAADVDLTAPDRVGQYLWEVRFAETLDRGVAHASVAAGFSVRTVPGADYRLVVIAIDRATQKPVEGARVVVHPFRSRTDDQGKAELDLPKGTYRVFVSGHDYIPFRADGELVADTAIRAELDRDLPPGDAELWP